MPNTGIAVLEGTDTPRLIYAGHTPKRPDPLTAEAALRERISEWDAEVVAIDAPLTLPPCLTCSPECPGPRVRCELEAARLLWDAGWNPTTRRWCELGVYQQVGERPLSTMRLGEITARAVVLARELTRSPATVLEVYPRATLRRLAAADERFARPHPGEQPEQHHARVLAGLSNLIGGVAEHPLLTTNRHVLDALTAAYTGWLWPDKLEPPPALPLRRSGWIWFPSKASPDRSELLRAVSRPFGCVRRAPQDRDTDLR